MATFLMICAVALEVVGIMLVIYRVMRFERCLESLSRRCDERFYVVEQGMAELIDDGGGLSETRADERQKALEAERRFTEGVANILSFSCSIGGRKSE